MTRSLQLTIEIPDDVTEITVENLPRIEFVVNAEGVDADAFVPLLLVVAEIHLQGEMREALSEQNPLEPPVLITAAAIMNARLRLVDEAMHLPMRPGTTVGIEY